MVLSEDEDLERIINEVSKISLTYLPIIVVKYT